MEILWEHGYHGHYVLIESEGISCSNYFLTVIKENHVPGLLPVQKRSTEKGIAYAYEITGRESLGKQWKVCSLNYRDMKNILIQLTDIVKQSEEYLLDSDKLLLEPDVMFLENGRLLLCYYPEKQTGFYEAFRGLAERMMKETDHLDLKGTGFIYGIYDACRKDTFVLEKYLKESWKEENSVQEKTLPVTLPPPAEKKRPEKHNRLWRMPTGTKRKRREQIRQEFWSEVWKLKGNQEFVVDKSPFIIGKRNGEVDACIENSHVSRKHAKLEQERGLFFLTDLGSTNGTYINGRRILAEKKEAVSPGDRISFADQMFLLVKEAEGASE